MNADSIRIESDERGFVLVMQLDIEVPLVTDEGRLTVRLPADVAEGLYRETLREVLPWLVERDEARSTVPQGYVGEGAYELNNPKHPEFHSVHADIWDAREKGLL